MAWSICSSVISPLWTAFVSSAIHVSIVSASIRWFRVCRQMALVVSSRSSYFGPLWIGDHSGHSKRFRSSSSFAMSRFSHQSHSSSRKPIQVAPQYWHCTNADPAGCHGMPGRMTNGFPSLIIGCRLRIGASNRSAHVQQYATFPSVRIAGRCLQMPHVSSNYARSSIETFLVGGSYSIV